MSLKLYMDEHVASAITDGLRLRNVDVLTVQDDGRKGISDAIILKRATELGRIVFTMDEDFFREASLLQAAGQHFAGVVYARQLSVTIGHCVKDLELICKASEPEDLADRIDVLPL